MFSLPGKHVEELIMPLAGEKRPDWGAHWHSFDLPTLSAVWLKSEGKQINLAPQRGEGRKLEAWRGRSALPMQ